LKISVFPGFCGVFRALANASAHRAEASARLMACVSFGVVHLAAARPTNVGKSVEVIDF